MHSDTARARRRKYAVPQMPCDVLWLWGRMRDFERNGFFIKDKTRLVSNLPAFARADLMRVTPKAAEFFARLAKEVRND